MGRAPSGKPPIQSVKVMQERYNEIIRRLIAGETQAKIALEIGMSQTRLSIVCNSPLFQQELAKRRGDVDKRFNETTGDIKARIDKLQEKAIDVLELIVAQDVDNAGNIVPLRLKKDTAIDILDIAGNGRQTSKKDNSTDEIVKLISEGFKVAQENRKMELELAKEAKNMRNITNDRDVDIDMDINAYRESANSPHTSLVPYSHDVNQIERVS